MTFTDSTKNVINDCINNCIVSMISNKETFSIIVSSRFWDKALPERLSSQDHFIIQIQEQAQEDSYIDKDGIPVILTEFDNIENSITLYPEYVIGILDITMQNPILMKPFKENHTALGVEEIKKMGVNILTCFTDEELTDGVQHSIKCLMKSNPDMFVEVTS